MVQGADVLIYRRGTAVAVTVSAPLPWPTPRVPSRQKWSLLQGPKGEQLWLGDQGGTIWGDRNEEIRNGMITFEERNEVSPLDIPKTQITENIDRLIKEINKKRTLTHDKTRPQFFHH